MAKAKRTPIKVKKVVVKEEGIRLDLSIEEAQFLRAVLHRVGGDPNGGRRHQEPISTALRRAGIFVPENRGYMARSGGVYFADIDGNPYEGRRSP